MTNCQITCITKPNRLSTHEHITHVGNPAWSMKMLTVEDVITRIRNKTDSFYVKDQWGKTAYVGVVEPGHGRRPYIRTHADGVWNDNLLSLNECPI